MAAFRLRERPKNQAPISPVNSFILNSWKATQEFPAVRLGEHAGIEDRDQSAVGFAANQAADSLAKFDQGVGQGQLVEPGGRGRGIALPVLRSANCRSVFRLTKKPSQSEKAS